MRAVAAGAVIAIALTSSAAAEKVSSSSFLFDVKKVDGVGFGTVLVIDFDIENWNPFPIKDIDISCELFAKSGTSLQVKTYTHFDIVPGNGRKRFRKANLGFVHQQTAKVGCRATGAVKG